MSVSDRTRLEASNVRLISPRQSRLVDLVVGKEVANFIAGDARLLAGKALPDAEMLTVAEVELLILDAADIHDIRLIELPWIATRGAGHNGNARSRRGRLAPPPMVACLSERLASVARKTGLNRFSAPLC